MKSPTRMLLALSLLSALSFAPAAYACPDSGSCKCECCKKGADKGSCSGSTTSDTTTTETSKDARASLNLKTQAKENVASFGRHGKSAMARERILKQE
ncbi:MAG: hypothetical protein K1X79_08435 [Oligoflexia bacterium]|nr:hypothetical protein [Oligoflexia bacterium]